MVRDENDQDVDKTEKEVWAYILPGFKDCLLDLPTYSTYNPVKYPEQCYKGILPTDHDEQELFFRKIRKELLKNPWDLYTHSREYWQIALILKDDRVHV